MNLDFTNTYNDLITNFLIKIVPKIYNNLYQRFKTDNTEQFLQDAYSNYYTNLLNQIGYIKPIYDRKTPIKIMDLYVPMLLKDNNNQTYNPDNPADLLTLHPKFININGSGGIGKTTIVKALTIKLLEQKSFAPIYIEIRKFTPNNSDNINDLLHFILQSMHRFDIDFESFKNLIAGGKHVFIIDGFDEIKYEHQSIIYKKLEALRESYTNNHFIITSRDIDLIKNGWSNSITLYVEPLNLNQSKQLISKINTFDKHKKTKFLEILDDTTFNEINKEFLSNPLLLNIMLMTFDKFSEIPEKRHIFFEKAYQTLYSEHDSNKGSLFKREKLLEKDGMSEEDIKRVIGSFSLLSYYNGVYSFINKKNFFTYINHTKNNQDRLLYLPNFENDSFERDIVDSICLLVKDGEEYRYLHRSFQEYFAANCVLNLTSSKQKELLESLLNRNPESFTSDEFFNMLYDMNQEVINVVFFLHLLEKNFKLNDTYQLLNFIKSSYPVLYNDFQKSMLTILVQNKKIHDAFLIGSPTQLYNIEKLIDLKQSLDKSNDLDKKISSEKIILDLFKSKLKINNNNIAYSEIDNERFKSIITLYTSNLLKINTMDNNYSNFHELIIKEFESQNNNIRTNLIKIIAEYKLISRTLQEIKDKNTPHKLAKQDNNYFNLN